MNLGMLTLAVTTALAVGGVTTAVVVSDTDRDTTTRTSSTPVRHEPGQDMLTQRLGTGVPADAFQQAAEQALGMRTSASLASAPQAARGGGAATRWEPAGPTNIGGRLVDIAQSPDDRETLWVAAAGGGVWKSTDGGRTFEESWPTRLTQAVGALTVGQDGTLWAGTGETNPGGGSTTYAGTGLYKSTDGGETWRSAGLEDSRRIGRIVIDPTDVDRMWVAVSGDLFRPGGTRGLYRSDDGGKTFQKVLGGATPTAGAVDIAIDPQDTDTVYSIFWDHLRTPEVRSYGGPGSRAYKSTDGGETWEQMTEGLPAPGPDTGRMGIAVAPSDPDRLYLIHVDKLGGFAGFFTSADAGETWSRTADNALLRSSQSSYGWWFGRVWVAPDDAADVWVAGVPLLRSRDGGQTWGFGAAHGVHVDHHAMLWDPEREGRIFLGNDGGFYRTTDDGTTWTKAEEEPYTQFYTVDVGEQDPSRIVGGAQDNGCNRSYGDAQGWNRFSCGDGLETLINPEDQDLVYSCSQYGSCNRSTDGGETNRRFSGSTVSDRRNWKTPVEFDPNDPQVMYYAGNRVNRSTDGGQTWSVISPDLTTGPSADPQYPYGTVTTIAAATTDPRRLYVGTDDHRVWTSPDGGASWERIDDGLPEAWVTRVRVDPTDEDVVYATLSGFRAGEAAAHVFRSTDGGESWNDISANLPNAPVNDVVLDGRHLYVASDVGVFLSPDTGRSWVRFGRELPVTPSMELRVHQPSRSLFTGTFGRGMYRTQLHPGAR